MRGPASRTIIGDLCLEEMGIVVERVHDDPPKARADTVDVPGRDGSVLRSVTYGPRDITLECRVFSDKWADFDGVVDELAAHLMGHGTMPVVLRTHPDETYEAYLSSIEPGDRVGGTGIGYVELALVAPDPYRKGKTQHATIPSGGSATFLVGGTEPAAVRITAPAAVRKQSSQVWGVRFDDQEFIHVITRSASSRSVTIDCEKRHVELENATTLPTIDSDWPVLKPGKHTVTMDNGTGAATLEWTERSI